MSRGVVLWPDARTATLIRELWDTLTAHELPSMATHTHGLHQPHCSLTVAEELPVKEALGAIGMVPAQRIPLLVGSVGVFPPDGVLFLACIANQSLLREQRRVQEAIASVAVRPWPYFQPGAWVPHITLSWSLTPTELAAAIPLMLERLPISGVFDHGGVEDGASGDNWPATAPD